MTDVITAYREEITAARMTPDPAQERAALALQELYGQVLESSGWRQNLTVIGTLLEMCLSPFSFLSSNNHFKRHQSGVYLYGPVGRGKTRVMDLFFASLPAEIKKQRVHFHAFMLGVHEFLHHERQAGGKAGVDGALPKFAAHVAQSARILCFDEFHVVDVADAMILSRLMTALFDAGVQVVMTSNWPPEDLYKNGLQRELFLPFIDLIKTRMNVVAVDGGRDYRQARIAGRPVYFHPNGPAAQAALHEFFRDLTDDGVGLPVTIGVMGHEVIIPRAGHGVAWASFSDLCEKPFAAQDYLALAARFHTLLIDHVPRLTYDRRNETKRFMILVDILYEHHRRLIVAADAAADKLFVDNEHAFEFKRTLSRLAEMQSVQYLDQVNEAIE